MEGTILCHEDKKGQIHFTLGKNGGHKSIALGNRSIVVVRQAKNQNYYIYYGT